MKTLLFIATASALLISAHAEDTLKLVATVSLPGVTGRFDHFAIDPKGQRLFVAALGNNSLEVIDVLNMKPLTNITGRKPTGVVFIPEQNQVGVAAGDDGVLKVFSGVDYKPVATVGSLDDADNVRLNRTNSTLLVGYGDGALAIIDVKTWKKTGEIKLPGHPESFQLDQAGDRVYINVPSKKEVALGDISERRVIAKFPMTKFQANFPMALDPSNGRLFFGCRNPSRLVALDKEKGKELADIEISGDTDDLFYDAKRQAIYISCGEGFIDVVNARPGIPLERIDKIPTRTGARTSFYSPDLDRFFLAVPKHEAAPAEIRVYQPLSSSAL
jgi:hypothetical protein